MRQIYFGHDSMSATNLHFSSRFPLLLGPNVSESKDLTLELLNDLVLLCPDAIIGTNTAGTIILFNRAAESLLGYKSADTIDHRNVVDIYGSLEKAKAIKKLICSPERGGEGRLAGYECELVDSEGRVIPIRLSAALLYRHGLEVGCVGFFHDISDRKALEAELRALSFKDSLSGLYNQRAFYEKLRQELSRNARTGNPCSLLCIDLDHFKQFNDSLGHLEGDKVIKQVGAILLGQSRDIDVPCRYGGDEFMVLLPETSLPDACQTAGRMMENFYRSWPFAEQCGRLGIEPVTMSMGVAEARWGEAPLALVKRADDAMYRAKRSGANRIMSAE